MKLNSGFGEGAGVEFVALGWEDTLASTGRRSQGVINAEIDHADVFILTMHSRWGQDAPDAAPYSSYTEEEFHRAFERWKKEEKPEIFVFFKQVGHSELANPTADLEKVLKFRKELEKSKVVLYRSFADAPEFAREVDRHLRAFVKGTLPREAVQDAVVLPLDAINAVDAAREAAHKAILRAVAANQRADADMARAEELSLMLAQQAVLAASEGRVEEARQSFAKVVDGTKDLKVLFLAYCFYEQVGDLNMAEEMCKRRLAIGGRDIDTLDSAHAYGNRGITHQVRGEYQQAEEMFNKALSIYRSFGNWEGIADQLGNLGTNHFDRGDFVTAERMLRQSIALERRIGRIDMMATAYENLAIVFRRRGEPKLAREMLEESLALEQQLERKAGIARVCGSIGWICQDLNQLDEAGEMHRRALAIYERLQNRVGIATCLGNLGVVHLYRNEFDQAEQMFQKVLAIHKSLNSQSGEAIDYHHLSLVAKGRGDMREASRLAAIAVKISDQIGMNGLSDHIRREFPNLV